MSTPDTVVDRAPDPQRYCANCGEALAGGLFCANCGSVVARPGGGGPGRRGGRNTVALTAAVVVLVLVAAGLAIALMRSGGGDTAKAGAATGAGNAAATYRSQVGSALRPVAGANREVSGTLGRLRGTKPTNAIATVREARTRTTVAVGALGALAVPVGQRALDIDARQLLDREQAYLAAVSAVLADPSSPTRSQLATLSSNLTAAISAIGGSVAGSSLDVANADRLAAWAPRAARTLKRRAAARRRVNPDRSSAGGATPAPETSAAANGLTAFQTGTDAGERYAAAYCRIGSGSVYCWTPNDGYTLQLDRAGARRLRGAEAGNRGNAPGLPTLSAGSTTTAAGVSCTSGSTGLRCTSASGHGFSLPRYRGLPALY